MAEWRVEDAGTDINGDYSQVGTYNGQPLYLGPSPANHTYLYFGGATWGFSADPGVAPELYYGTGATLPANPWNVDGGTPPAPTVSAIEELPTPDGWASLTPMRAQMYYSPGGCLQAIKAWVRATSSTCPVQAGLYDSSMALVALSQMGQAQQNAAWVELSFGNYPTLEGESATYYLAVWAPWGAAEIGLAGFYYGRTHSNANDLWPDWPDPAAFQAEGRAFAIVAVLGDEAAGGGHPFAYSVEDPDDAPVAGGRHGFAYSVGVQGRHGFAYSVGTGGRHRFAYSVGRSGKHAFAYSIGVGGGHRFAYSRGPWTNLAGRHRFSYSVGQGASGSHAFAYSVGEKASGRHRFSFSVGEKESGAHKFAYSIGGPAAADEFSVLDLLRLRRGPVG